MSDPQPHSDSIDEPLRKRFEQAWADGNPQPIDSCIPAADDAGYLATLEELVHIELEFAWKSWARDRRASSTAETIDTTDTPPRVETYLSRFPRLDQPEILLRLLQQECLVRSQAGDVVSIEQYQQRFPQLAPPEGLFESILREAGAPGAGTSEKQPIAATRAGRFGNYELLEEIGRGGMGVVYRARQCTADRIVALKVVRRELLESERHDSQTAAMDRFRHETRAAARLEHENIVTVYEVGDVDGEPFFSMRYVDGSSLRETVREGPISNRRAAEYLEPVARAVNEAHAEGILHRDLKPQNILVDKKTDRAMVADFGLAKLSEIGEELTHAGEVMGTPSYMSPEQAQDSSRVTARTDVYALGATLYCLLTGRPPFQAATGVETLRQVIDEEPVRPGQLNPSIDRDLETICVKCLQKEPARRYDSARLLADDLRRYLRGEPILARPIGSLQRTWRWCRRNPVVAALIGSTATFLILALLATAVGYVKTTAALMTAESARRQAEENYRQAREAVDNLYTRVSEDTLLNQPGMQPLRKELLEEALRYYRKFLSRRSDDLTIQPELALANFRAGRITEEIDSPEKSLTCYRRARDIQRRLLAREPNDPDRLEDLGATHNAVGRVLHRLRQFDAALQAYEEAVAVRRRLAATAPERSEFQRVLANSIMNAGLLEKERGRLQSARENLEEAQLVRRAIRRPDLDRPQLQRDLAIGHYNLAVLAMMLRDDASAQRNLRDAIAILEKLLAGHPKDLANQHRLVICYRILADLKSTTADRDAAMGLYREALQRMEQLALANPDVPEYQAALAGLQMNLGQLHRERNAPDLTRTCFHQALQILDKLAGQGPSIPRYRRDLAVTLRAIGTLDLTAGDDRAAEESLLRSQQHLRTLVEEFPGNEEFELQLSETTALLEGLRNGD